MTIKELFNLDKTISKDYLNKYKYPFEVRDNINNIIIDLFSKLDNDYLMIKENVYAHKSAAIGKNVEIIGPCIIGKNTEIRHNAYIRENVIIGDNVVIGNSCEIKNSIIFDDAQIPHFNYVGDSILGNFTHLGAGVVIANLRLDKRNVQVENEETSLRKIGAFIGDRTEIGCNSVICPGTAIEKDSIIYPLSVVNKKYPSNIKPERL